MMTFSSLFFFFLFIFCFRGVVDGGGGVKEREWVGGGESLLHARPGLSHDAPYTRVCFWERKDFCVQIESR